MTKEQIESLLQEARCSYTYSQAIYDASWYEEDYRHMKRWLDEIRHLEAQLEEFEQ